MTPAASCSSPELAAGSFPEGTIMLLEDFYITMSEIPDHTSVLEYVESTPSSNGGLRTDPLWAVLCVVIGAALLVASGVFLLVLGVKS